MIRRLGIPLPSANRLGIRAVRRQLIAGLGQQNGRASLIRRHLTEAIPLSGRGAFIKPTLTTVSQHPRWYSTSPSPTSNHNVNDQIGLTAAHELSRNDAVPVVRDERSSPESEMEIVQESFRVLEQLGQGDNKPDGVGGESSDKLGENVLVNAVVQWQNWWTRLPAQSPLAQSSSPWTTDRVWNKVQQFQETLPELGPSDLLRIYNAILAGYLAECQRGNKSTTAKCLQRAKSIVENQMLQERVVKPNAKSYELLLEMHAIVGDIQGAIAILDFVLQQQPAANEKEANFRLDYSIFEKLLQACVDWPSRDRGMAADHLMQRMMRLSELELLSSRPQAGHFTQVMDAWAKSEHPRAGERTMEIWEYLRHASYQEKQWWLKPDTTTFLCVLHALARLGQAETAETVLLQAWQEKGSFKPDRANVNAVLDAWARTKTYRAGERAERLLRMMQENAIEPDIISYTSAIHAWGTSGHPAAGARAEHLFEEVSTLARSNPDMEPNTMTYNTLISAWAKVKNVKRAEDVLGTMCSNYLSGKPTKAIPSIMSFASVLDAYARSKDPWGAEELLRKMEDSGIPHVTPTTVCYNTVINAWALSGEPRAGQEGERLLREMQGKKDAKVAPDLTTYNSVINAHARSRQGAFPAERLLRELQEMAQHRSDRRLRPNIITYNSVLNACAKQRKPQLAETLLKEMKKQGGDIAPNSHSYISCIEAWSRSGLPEGGEKADACLVQMKPFSDKGKRLAMRYELALRCWKNSACANHPQAPQRIEELDQTIKDIMAGSARKLES